MFVFCCVLLSLLVLGATIAIGRWREQPIRGILVGVGLAVLPALLFWLASFGMRINQERESLSLRAARAGISVEDYDLCRRAADDDYQLEGFAKQFHNLRYIGEPDAQEKFRQVLRGYAKESGPRLGKLTVAEAEHTRREDLGMSALLLVLDSLAVGIMFFGDGRRRCPSCCRRIARRARRCPYCRENLPAIATVLRAPVLVDEPPPLPKNYWKQKPETPAWLE
jgi:hypothetical protein